MKAVPLYGGIAAGRVTLVDAGDYELVMQYRWNVRENRREGWRPNGPYAVAPMVIDGKLTVKGMHSLITGWPLVDHADHDGLNNQRSNLRPATKAQNGQNRRSTLGSSSTYKGVSWVTAKRKWMAQISANKRMRYLGYFSNEEEAALAYNAAAAELFGEFAYLNEIPQTGDRNAA